MGWERCWVGIGAGLWIGERCNSHCTAELQGIEMKYNKTGMEGLQGGR